MDLSPNANRASLRVGFHRWRDFIATGKALTVHGLEYRVLKRTYYGDSPTVTFLVSNALPTGRFNQKQRDAILKLSRFGNGENGLVEIEEKSLPVGNKARTNPVGFAMPGLD